MVSCRLSGLASPASQRRAIFEILKNAENESEIPSFWTLFSNLCQSESDWDIDMNLYSLNFQMIDTLIHFGIIQVWNVDLSWTFFSDYVSGEITLHSPVYFVLYDFYEWIQFELWGSCNRRRPKKANNALWFSRLSLPGLFLNLDTKIAISKEDTST